MKPHEPPASIESVALVRLVDIHDLDHTDLLILVEDHVEGRVRSTDVETIHLSTVDRESFSIATARIRFRMGLITERAQMIFYDTSRLFVDFGQKFPRLVAEKNLIPHSDVLKRNELVTISLFEEKPAVFTPVGVH